MNPIRPMSDYARAVLQSRGVRITNLPSIEEDLYLYIKELLTAINEAVGKQPPTDKEISQLKISIMNNEIIHIEEYQQKSKDSKNNLK